MKKNLAVYGHRLLALLFSLTLVVINLLRIFKIPITMDETGYNTHDSYMDLLREKYPSANNHILHSLIRKFLVETFNDSLFYLRVDSFLAQLVYIIFTYLLCAYLFKNRWWQLICFVMMNIFSPLLFQFWGLSRGYALSISFMVVSIYYTLRYYEGRKSLHLILCLLAAILASMCNFSLLNYTAALFATIMSATLIFYPRSGSKKNDFKELFILLASGLLLAVLTVEPLITLRMGGELQFLGNRGFYDDTLFSIAESNLMRGDNYIVHLVDEIAVVIVIMQGIYWISTIIKTVRQKRTFEAETVQGILLYMFLCIACAGLVFQNKVFHINYIIDRAAMYLAILFIIQLLFWLYSIRQSKKVVCDIVLGILVLLVSFNFITNVDLYNTHLWWYNRDDMTILNRIVTESQQTHHKIRLGIDGGFTGTFSYDTRKYFDGKFEPLVTIKGNQGYDTTFDFYYIGSGSADNLPKCYEKDTIVVGGAFTLYRRREM